MPVAEAANEVAYIARLKTQVATLKRQMKERDVLNIRKAATWKSHTLRQFDAISIASTRAHKKEMKQSEALLQLIIDQQLADEEGDGDLAEDSSDGESAERKE